MYSFGNFAFAFAFAFAFVVALGFAFGFAFGFAVSFGLVLVWFLWGGWVFLVFSFCFV